MIVLINTRFQWNYKIKLDLEFFFESHVPLYIGWLWQYLLRYFHYYDDGSYIVETYTFENPTINLCATTKTGTKTAVYYSKDNIAQWSVAVKGTFS